MKRNSVIKLEIGNIRINVMLGGFWHYGYKAGEAMHSHAGHEMHVLLNGGATLETDATGVELKENDCVIVPPDLFHDFVNQEKGSTILSITFSISVACKKNVRDYSDIASMLMYSDNLTVIHHNSDIADIARRITANIYSNHFFAEEKVRALFYMMFTEILSELVKIENHEQGTDLSVADNDTRIYMIEEYFNEFYMEDISLKKLAELMYMSEKQTNRMIRKAFGEGFRQRLSRIRMLSAKRLLKDTDMEIQDIAGQVGYESYNGFYLAFKKKNGITPQEYRRISEKK